MSLKNPVQPNPFNTTVPIEAVGLEASLCPFMQFITGQRSNMFASNLWQAVVIDGAEYPRISTGIENQIKRYSFDTTKREGDAIVFETIPKFICGPQGARRNPTTFIIYTVGNKANYIEVSDHTKLYNGFGYENEWTSTLGFINRGRGMPLDQDMILSRPPNHTDKTLGTDEELYCQGVNANILFTTMPHVAEDSLLISRSLAEKCQHLAINTVKISLDPNDVPLNIYGTQDDPKAFPDIGDVVNSENILIALRKKSPERLAALTSASLQRVLYGDDATYYAPAGAKIIDVQVYCDAKSVRDNERDPGVMSQIYDYQQMHYRFYDQVVKVYRELQREGFNIDSKLSDLITNALAMRRQKNPPHMTNGRGDIRNCVLELTYSYKRKVGPGFKYSGRSGDKGVVSTIWEDEDMPTDEFGIRADMVACFSTVSNRINTGQCYEQDIGRLSELMRLRLADGKLGKGVKAFNAIMEFIADVHAEYAAMLMPALATEELQLDFVDTVATQGFYHLIPPFQESMTMDKIRYLHKKYKYKKTPVTFTYDVGDGRRKTVTTIQPMAIGPKYVYLLGKIPKQQMSAHEMTHINQFQIPVKSDSKAVKQQYSTAPTPIRFGEDELGQLSMLPEPEETARFLMMRAGSHAASEMVGQTILSAGKPTAVRRIPMTTKTMVEHSNTIKLMGHMMGIVGVDMSDTSAGRNKGRRSRRRNHR